MTPAEFAQLQGVSERTVQRWLKDGEVPGARRGRDGRWHLPADARRVIPLDDAADDTTPPRRDVAPVSPGVAVPAQGLSLAEMLARQPAYVGLDVAAFLLGLSEAEIRRNRAEFGARRWSSRGPWRVPVRVIRAHAGLSPEGSPGRGEHQDDVRVAASGAGPHPQPLA